MGSFYMNNDHNVNNNFDNANNQNFNKSLKTSRINNKKLKISLMKKNMN